MKKRHLCVACGLAAALASCTLAEEMVEPALPQGRINNSSTVVFRLDGQPVVANVATNIGTFIAALFADPRQVTSKLGWDSTLVVRARDESAGPVTHYLTLGVPKFKGVGSYQLLPNSSTSYSKIAKNPNANGVYDRLDFQVASTGVGEFVVTSWEPATRRLTGTFRLTLAAGGRRVVITEGAADIDVDK